MRSTPTCTLALAAALALAPTAAGADTVKIKLGTLAPEGSPWHTILVRMGQRMKAVPGSNVELLIYPGGVAGDEGDMVRKMKLGQLHAATITNIGLGRISRASLALQVPMTISSYEQLDEVRKVLGPELKAELEKEGFVVLNWGDAGWVHFFSTKPVKTPDDLRKLKLFAWSGDPESERAWKAAGFTTVALSSTDVLASLKTGMVEAFATAPIYALAANWHDPAKHMLKLNWTPLNGATVVLAKQWNKIDPAVREQLLVIAEEEGAALRAEVRSREGDAIKAMVDRGLSVVEPSAADIAAWTAVARMAYPEIRGKVVPEQYFDRVVKLTGVAPSAK